MRECDDVRGLLAGLVYDELAAADRPRLEAHLSGCAECRAALESMREASSALDAWTPAPVRRKKATRRRVAAPPRKPAHTPPDESPAGNLQRPRAVPLRSVA